VETVGISNFVTFLERTEAYRRDLRRVKYGDERDPAQRAKLMDISPLTHADRIRAPLMVITGANDPRVPASEAEQIIEAVRRHGVTVWSVLAANEGHGFARKENIDYASLAQLLFWKTHLLN
jgi:dipeptidyl aminopeptidase/acylaminoacyl peptidase